MVTPGSTETAVKNASIFHLVYLAPFVAYSGHSDYVYRTVHILVFFDSNHAPESCFPSSHSPFTSEPARRRDKKRDNGRCQNGTFTVSPH